MRPKAPDTGRDCSSPRAQLRAGTAAPGSGPAAGCEREDAGRIGRMMDGQMDENKWLRFLCGSGCQVDNQELIKTTPDGLAGRTEKWIRVYSPHPPPSGEPASRQRLGTRPFLGDSPSFSGLSQC